MPTTGPSTFLKDGEPLGDIEQYQSSDLSLKLPNNEHIFLRLIPTLPTEPLPSAKATLDLLESSNLFPMGNIRGSRTNRRNLYGAFVVHYDGDRVRGVTQLFKNRELWGIETDLIDKPTLIRWVESTGRGSFGFFPCGALEEIFNVSLANYLEFAEKTLSLPTPLRFIAGVTGVQGYRMAAPRGMQFGAFEPFSSTKALEPNIIFQGTIDSYQVTAGQVLLPFYKRIWEECGLERPDKEKLS